MSNVIGIDVSKASLRSYGDSLPNSSYPHLQDNNYISKLSPDSWVAAYGQFRPAGPTPTGQYCFATCRQLTKRGCLLSFWERLIFLFFFLF